MLCSVDGPEKPALFLKRNEGEGDVEGHWEEMGGGDWEEWQDVLKQKLKDLKTKITIINTNFNILYVDKGTERLSKKNQN
jgi:hypothetical protein